MTVYYDRPSEDLYNGDWQTAVGSSSELLYEQIDETTPDDSTYIFINLNTSLPPDNRKCRMRLAFDSEPPTFESGKMYKARVRARVNVTGTSSGPPSMNVVGLIVGFHSGNNTLGGHFFEPIPVDQGFQEKNFWVYFNGDQVPDADDLRIQFVGTIYGEERRLEISWAVVEVEPYGP